MKKYRLCIVLALLTCIISSCNVLPTSNTVSPTTIITPILTKSYIYPSESPAVSPSFPLLPTASINNHPSESLSTSPTSSIQPTASADPIMINEQNYFKFGMSRKSVEKELKKLGIKITYEGSDSDDEPDGFYFVSTDKMGFDFNDQNQLYSISVCGGETAKGLKIGDPMEKVQQLYGKQYKLAPNEIASDYIYHCNGYMFSVNLDSSNDTVNGWSVFLNIWNDPNSYGITNAMYASDVSIQFNEENFSDLFTFGMSREELKKRLTGLGIRIDSEDHYQSDDENTWGVHTDHVQFGFDKRGLFSVYVVGWETANGLQIGDSIEKLHKLYGQENNIEDGYIYNMKGYKFDVFFDKNDGLDSWFIYTKR